MKCIRNIDGAHSAYIKTDVIILSCKADYIPTKNDRNTIDFSTKTSEPSFLFS